MNMRQRRASVNVGQVLQEVWVPGSFELPLVAKAMAASGKYDAVLALGAVVCP